MDPIRPDRAEAIFEDYKPAYTASQALVEANRCLYCEDAPCMVACPTHIDIAQFIRKIATGNVRGSARTIFDANILGMSCARVCWSVWSRALASARTSCRSTSASLRRPSWFSSTARW